MSKIFPVEHFLFFAHDKNSSVLYRRVFVKNLTVFDSGQAIPTILPPRYRQVTFDVTDRPSADGLVLTTTNVGRDIYLRVCFYPGTPFNRKSTRGVILVGF